jgi:ubiquinone/menaquinone biosynthesis C-methylase UbiE
MSPMDMRSKSELRAQIEAHHRRHLGRNGLSPKLDAWVDFEMRSVELHRTNLVPFVRGHGAVASHRILDFGSGPGCSACAIAMDLGARVCGVEPGLHNKTLAPLWAEYCDVTNLVEFHFTSDTLHLPFRDEAFDFVIASSVLEYIPGDRGPYLREMWRVLKRGGRLLIAGTSNAAWPREVHSKTWLVNWMPNLGPNIRQRLGRKGPVERGVTFGQIQAALSGSSFVRGDADQLRAFAGRLFDRAPFPAPLRGGMEAMMARALHAIDDKTESVTGWPAEAFLPWLNVAFERAP